MNKPLLDQVFASLNALMADELASDRVGRYVAVAKLCGHADKIRQMSLTRVGDVQQEEEEAPSGECAVCPHMFWDKGGHYARRPCLACKSVNLRSVRVRAPIAFA